ncbi:MAG: hypothetical protein ABR590_11605, partial [Spirochaetia bacterium]
VETVVNTKLYEDSERILADRLTRIRLPVRDTPADTTAPAEAWEETRRVRRSDLDGQNHTNNMTYLEWILDGFDGPLPGEFELGSFRINFLKETHYRDLVELWYTPLNSAEDVAVGMAGIALQDDGASVLAAELTFVPRRV